MADPKKIQELSAKYFAKIKSVREHLHMNPELSFKEFETSKYIQKQLSEAGIAFTTGHVKTGIVAEVRGKNPGSHTVLLRADMDALPIEERNNVPYRSKNKGVMHACGHDVHSACALGAAFILNEIKEEFEGTVRIMFQPGEEMLPGGANLMIKEGVLDNPPVERAIALHVFPGMDAGKVGFRPGMYMASTDELYLTVRGKGGHAAMTAEYVNPLIIASEILLGIHRTFMLPGALNGTPGENIPTVIAFGKIDGQGATNIIPDNVQIEGTFRTLNESWREAVHEKLHEIIKLSSEKYGIDSTLRIERGYPFLVNDEKFTMACSEAAKELVGSEKVYELPVRMTAEDFAFITQKVPSCFFRLGTDNKSKGITSGVHTATFDIDEKALVTGMSMMAWLAVRALQHS